MCMQGHHARLQREGVLAFGLMMTIGYIESGSSQLFSLETGIKELLIYGSRKKDTSDGKPTDSTASRNCNRRR